VADSFTCRGCGREWPADPAEKVPTEFCLFCLEGAREIVEHGPKVWEHAHQLFEPHDASLKFKIPGKDSR
jgi:hypothetical protein